MNYADKYAQSYGHKDAKSMLEAVATRYARAQSMGTAIEYSVQDAVIRALIIIDQNKPLERLDNV